LISASPPSALISGKNGKSKDNRRDKGTEADWSCLGTPIEDNDRKVSENAKRGGRAGGVARGGKVGVAGGRELWKEGELRRRKVDKHMIGPPTDFR